MKKIFFIFCTLICLTGCAQNLALLGPAISVVQTGGIQQAIVGETINYGVKNKTGKNVSEHAMSLLQDEVEMDLDEDGHDDVPSAVRAMKTMAEDALEMLDALEQMDGTLPTWWTNKMAVSASMLNKMRDYLLVPSEDEVLDEQ